MVRIEKEDNIINFKVMNLKFHLAKKIILIKRIEQTIKIHWNLYMFLLELAIPYFPSSL